VASDVTIARGPRAATTRLTRWAVLAVFFINGAVVASYVAHIPYLKARFGLNDGQLGLTLLAVAGGVGPGTASGRRADRPVW